MKVYVSYVTHENGLGTYVLGVRRLEEDAKSLCQAHYDHIHDDQKTLEWAAYREQQTKGVQSVNDAEALTYYVEGTELDFEVDGTIDRRLLEMEARLGQLAQRTLEQISMWKPLEDRQIVLEGHIDHLLVRLGEAMGQDLSTYEFPGGEIWGKGEQV